MLLVILFLMHFVNSTVCAECKLFKIKFIQSLWQCIQIYWRCTTNSILVIRYNVVPQYNVQVYIIV